MRLFQKRREIISHQRAQLAWAGKFHSPWLHLALSLIHYFQRYSHLSTLPPPLLLLDDLLETLADMMPSTELGTREY